MFSRNAQVRYVEKSGSFPATTVWSGDWLGEMLQPSRQAGRLTSIDEVDASDWIRRPVGLTLFAQTLFQENGYAATLLVAKKAQVQDNEPPRWPR